MRRKQNELAPMKKDNTLDVVLILPSNCLGNVTTARDDNFVILQAWLHCGLSLPRNDSRVYEWSCHGRVLAAAQGHSWTGSLHS